MFDFSDDKQAAMLHLVFNIKMKILDRDTFIGNISPITGAILLTENSAIYLYGI
jgi:lipid A 3-O-deacylase